MNISKLREAQLEGWKELRVLLSSLILVGGVLFTFHFLDGEYMIAIEHVVLIALYITSMNVYTYIDDERYWVFVGGVFVSVYLIFNLLGSMGYESTYLSTNIFLILSLVLFFLPFIKIYSNVG
jgi:uncharacterized membrane protein